MTDIQNMENLLCHVDISTECIGWQDELELIIEFKDGPLAGKDYKIDVKITDFKL